MACVERRQMCLILRLPRPARKASLPGQSFLSGREKKESDANVPSPPCRRPLRRGITPRSLAALKTAARRRDRTRIRPRPGRRRTAVARNSGILAWRAACIPDKAALLPSLPALGLSRLALPPPKPPSARGSAATRRNLRSRSRPRIASRTRGTTLRKLDSTSLCSLVYAASRRSLATRRRPGRWHHAAGGS